MTEQLVFDAHCHLWNDWPYATDDGLRTAGNGDNLIRTLDEHGVDRALVVCARIGGGHGGEGWPNPDNEGDVLAVARAHPGRLEMLVDLDSWWLPTYHRAGAADRLERAVTRVDAVGFTHYLDYTVNDGWLRSDEADAVFRRARDLGLVASIPVIGDVWLDDLAGLMTRHPEVPVLLHHLGLPRPDRLDADVAALAALARIPSLGVKVSGPYYCAPPEETDPYPTARSVLARLIDSFGPERLFWGSDWPVAGERLAYGRSLDLLREHAPGLSAHELSGVRGDNLAALLDARR